MTEIHYPVFLLGKIRPDKVDGVLFYFYFNEEVPVIKVVDDTNIKGTSLAMRRLRIKQSGEVLFKLKYAIYFLGDLIKIAKAGIWFIDSSGRVFDYHKQTRAKLVVYKIKQLIPINSGGAIVEAEGLSGRYKSLFYPERDKRYVGILHIGMSTILYGFYTDMHKETWRMV